jgi:hypothetical protein
VRARLNIAGIAMLAVAVMLVATPAAAQDSDAGASPGTATPLTPDRSAHDVLASPGDIDVFRVDVAAELSVIRATITRTGLRCEVWARLLDVDGIELGRVFVDSSASEVLSALAPTAGPLLGTIVGGVLTYETQQKLQDRELARQDRRDAVVARAAARLERDRLEVVAGQVDAMLADKHYVVIRTGLQSELSIDDRKLIAGRVDARAWQVVSEADLFLKPVAERLQHEPDGHAISIETQHFLGQASVSVHHADAPLKALADGR